jgi:hypothetical protein
MKFSVRGANRSVKHITDRWTGQVVGSGSFHHQAKIVRKTLILLFCNFLWLFIFEKWCKSTGTVRTLQKVISKKTRNKLFLLASCRSLTKRAGSGSESGSVTDLQHCLCLLSFTVCKLLPTPYKQIRICTVCRHKWMIGKVQTGFSGSYPYRLGFNRIGGTESGPWYRKA